MHRRNMVVAVAALLGVLVPGPAEARPNFPEVIALPAGFAPEGIAVGRGSTFYAGSLATGAIVRGDLRTGAYEVLVASADGPAVGIEVDQRNRVWVAGGPSAEIRVYDGSTGALLARYATPEGFINDLVVTKDAVYATNSFTGELAVIPLGPGGRLPAPDAVTTLPLVGFPVTAGAFNANGIEELRGQLVVANSRAEALFAVDPDTGVAVQIDIGGALPNVDGITLHGSRLYAVQNRLNQIAVIRLHPSLERGSVVDVVTDPDFVVPTTVAPFGNALYVVNAKFGVPNPTGAFEVIRARR